MRNRKPDPKVEALKKANAFNSRAQRVSDDLFQKSEFFDAQDIMQVKYEMLRRVREDGWSISRASAEFGFSRSSFYEAQSDFEEAGLAGFIPERRGPRKAHKLSENLLLYIEEVKQNDPLVRMSDLIELIKKQFGIDVHRRSIERAQSRLKKNSDRTIGTPSRYIARCAVLRGPETARLAKELGWWIASVTGKPGEYY